MKKNKTVETENSVSDFANQAEEKTKRIDSFAIIDIMQEETGFGPRMWGPGIIGFGSCHYKYESGREGDIPLACFSPRKAAIVLYLSNFPERAEMLSKFGKYKQGKGCIYIKKLQDINEGILRQMIKASARHMENNKQPC